MRNSYFVELEETIGLPGMKRLLEDLTCIQINNWHLARKWDIGIHDIRFLRHEALDLCGYVLNQEKKANQTNNSGTKIYQLSA